MHKVFIKQKNLTLIQIHSTCRRQNKCNLKIKKFFLGMVVNRKCWLPVFSPFPKMFSKASFLRVVNSQDCVNSLPNNKILVQSKLERFANDKKI